MNSEKTIIGCTSGGQLIQLSEGARDDLNVQTITLAGSGNDPVFYRGFSEEDGIIVPKGDFTDRDSLDAFAKKIKVQGGNIITTEWENIPWQSLKYLEETHKLICRPGWRFLQKIQDRKTEKELATEWGGEVVPYGMVSSLKDLLDHILELGAPCILKTRNGGYDGKGQWKVQEGFKISGVGSDKKVKNWDTIDEFWREMFPHNNPQNLILEKRIKLKSEVSVIAGIDIHGNINMIGPMLNHHENGILDASLSDAPIEDKLKKQILEKAAKIFKNAKNNKYIGVLTIEFFIDQDGNIMVNEFAPRTHNSGHATLDSHTHDQNHLWIASVAGQSVQDLQTEVKQKVLMLNILNHDTLDALREKFGDNSELSIGDGMTVKIYDYHKTPNQDTVRKVGHLNVYGEYIDEQWKAIQEGKMTLEQLSQDIKGRVAIFISGTFNLGQL